MGNNSSPQTLEPLLTRESLDAASGDESVRGGEHILVHRTQVPQPELLFPPHA